MSMMLMKKSLVLAMGLGAIAPWPAALAAAAAPKVDPQMQTVLDAMKALGPKAPHTSPPAEARKGITAKDAVEKVLRDAGKTPTPEKVAKVADRTVPGAVGTLPVRIYTPEGSGPFPLVVYFHGGGFVLADLDVYDASPRALANQAQAVVVSAHYRQAPEDPYPAAADDALAVYRYVQAHAKDFNGDADRIAVAGESAGGNLATGVAIRQKKDGAALPVFQLLVYPFVSNDLGTPSHRQNGHGNFLVGNKDLAWFWSNYLGEGWRRSKDVGALPIHTSVTALKGLPPAFVITAGLDPLKDEGEQYAKKLKAAGVAVETKNYEGVTHEFFGMGAVVDQAKQAQSDAAAALKRAFSSPTAGVKPTTTPPTSDPGIRPASAVEKAH